MKSTFNLKTKKYFAFSDSFVPDPINYRLDLWDDIGMKPDSWEEIRAGGKKIKDKTGTPVGIGLSNEGDTATALRAIIYSFGGSVQDENSRLVLNSKNVCYMIWKFADNIDGAKRFLVDYIGNFRQAFIASEFYNFPCFWNQVPDLVKLLESDTKAKPTGKYKALADSQEWTTNVGFPGYATAAIDETFSTWVLNTMFAQASTGALSPEDAIKDAEGKCKRIWAKWQERKLI